LLCSFGREDYENDPYALLLTVMGSEVEEPPPEGYVSDNIWYFDVECIYGDGSYVAIAQRMSVLASGALPLEDVQDRVGPENAAAWLSFRLDGRDYRWNAEVDGDWVDGSILTRLAELLPTRSSDKQFTYLSLAGQDCLIGCATKEQFNRLRGKTGLGFQWLTARALRGSWLTRLILNVKIWWAQRR